MVDGQSSIWAHRVRNSGLIVLSIALLPFDTTILVVTLLFRAICGSNIFLRRERIRAEPSFRPRRILVTGVGMTKGLVLARAFFKSGHDVIGADFEPRGALVNGRVSKALRAFYTLPQPDQETGAETYIERLRDIVLGEKVELWVSCSGVVSAVDDGRAKEVIERETSCKAIQFDAATTEMLHEKDTFIKHIASLGLKVPDTHTITGKKDAQSILERAQRGKKYIMKPVGVDDASRGKMALLPRKTSMETAKHLKELQISEKKPYILQQFIGGHEYCTQALVVKGEVKVFVACPSAELLMHYETLPRNSGLSMAMLDFTKKVAAHGGTSFTGHLSFDFLVESNRNEETHEEFTIYPIECNPRCHTAVVLFKDDSEALSRAYTSLLDEPVTGKQQQSLLTPRAPTWYYWTGHDLVTLFLSPLINLCSFKTTAGSFLGSTALFLIHLILWQDGTFEAFDPWPWWWLYHVYWPMQFLNSIWFGEKWSRINVSTTKMFKC